MAEFPTKSVGEVVTAADWNQIASYVGRGVIAEGSHNSTSPLVVDATGWDGVRVILAGSVGANGFLRMNVSGQTSGAYLYSLTAWRASDGAVVTSLHGANTSTANLGDWGTSDGHVLDLTLMQSDQGRASWVGHSSRISSTASSHRTSLATGRVSTQTALTTLSFVVQGDENLRVRYSIVGLKRTA